MSTLEALLWCREHDATIHFMKTGQVMVRIGSPLGARDGVVTPTLIESVQKLRQVLAIKEDESDPQ